MSAGPRSRRSWPLLSAALLLAGLFVLSVAGCGDDEAADEPALDVDPTFFGVAPDGEMNPTDYTRMAEGGVGMVRVVLQWSSIETPTGAYNWGPTDELLTSIAAAGMEPLPTLFGTPAAYARKPIVAPTDDPKALDAWSAFLTAAAQRYGAGGDFWSDFEQEHADVDAEPIREWQIWNEPNSSTFWLPAPDPADYAELVARSSDALEAGDPKAELMTAGMFATPQSDGAIDSDDFLRELFAVDGIKSDVDLVGIHPYGPDVDAVTDQVDAARKTLDDLGVDAPMWVTELGWGSDPDTKSQLAKTPEEQATLLTESFRTLAEDADRLGIAGVFWYTWHDTEADVVGACGWCASAGLVDADRDTKPAWIAYTDLTGGSP